MAARIYKVTTAVRDTTGEGASHVQLIEAENAAQAIRRAVRDHVTCEVCSVADALALGAAGTKVVKADE